MTLTFDLLTLKVVSESRVTWATSVPILVFLGLSFLDVVPMYATDRQIDVRQKHRLMPRLLGAGHNNACIMHYFGVEHSLCCPQPNYCLGDIPVPSGFGSYGK